MAALSVNVDRLGKRIKKLYGDESECDAPNGDRNIFDLFEDIDD